MTLVIDASAVAEVLLGTVRGRAVAARLAEQRLVAPGHLGVEVASVLRGWVLGGHLTAEEGLRALHEYGELGVEVLPTDSLLIDAWGLRNNLSAYDAVYVALARALECPLLTLDERLAKAAPDCAILP